MFYLGQKVVCIDDRFEPERLMKIIENCMTTPVEGEIYTIRDIVKMPEGTGFLLEEIVNAKQHFCNGNCEPLFYDYRFRPMIESDLVKLKQEESLEVSVKV